MNLKEFSKKIGLPVSTISKALGNYKDVNIALNRDCVGAVTFFTRESLDKVGLYDENYTNAFEHVDHSYLL